MPKKFTQIALYALSIAVLIAFITAIENDVLLAGIYAGVAAALMFFKKEKHDLAAYFVGLIGITISEYFFIRTGVETFNRVSLFGIMPLWLPFLWAYAFVVIKRTLRILDR
jgi:hypothetical protein